MKPALVGGVVVGLVVVAGVLFGTPFTKGLIKNYWGVGTKAHGASHGTEA